MPHPDLQSAAGSSQPAASPDPSYEILGTPVVEAVVVTAPSEVHDTAGQELLGFEDMMPPGGLRDRRRDRDELSPRAQVVKPALVECPHCGKTFVPAQNSVGTTRLAVPKNTANLKTILIVEDTEFFLEYAKDALSPLYRPITARTAPEALTLLSSEPVKLVVLDLGLQGENDGLEVLAAVRERRIPCIIFTARQETELWGAAWEGLKAKGASDLLIKGMNVEDQLLYKVAELLGEPATEPSEA